LSEEYIPDTVTSQQAEGIFQREIAVALEHLRRGGVVAIPTDTLYGLAADVFNDAALERIYTIKGRPSDRAIPVLVANWDQVERVTRDIPPAARQLAERFWPGQLTLVMRKAAWMTDLITGGRDSVAVRMPDHPVPLALATELSRPITGTSANLSGAPNLLSLDAVVAELGNKVDYIVRCGPAPQGIGSTIIDLTTCAPRLLRHGAVPFQQVLQTVR